MPWDTFMVVDPESIPEHWEQGKMHHRWETIPSYGTIYTHSHDLGAI